MSTLKDDIIQALEWPKFIYPFLQSSFAPANSKFAREVRGKARQVTALYLGVGAAAAYLGWRLFPRAADYTFGVPGMYYLATAASFPLSTRILRIMANRSAGNPDAHANAAEFAQNQAQNGPLSTGPLQPTVRGQTFAPLPKYPVERQFSQHTAQELV